MQNHSVTKQPFGKSPCSRDVWLYSLHNGQGASISVMNVGAALVSVKVPDRAGNIADIVLGLDCAEDYQRYGHYFGAIVGRYAGRIKHGRFSIDGDDYQLAVNNGANALHGGEKGFDCRYWHAEIIERSDGPAIKMHRISPDGEEGYPGTVDLSVTYCFDDQNRLAIDMHATSDQTTIINMTSHAYFNLDGHDAGSVADHQLQVKAQKYALIDQQLIPTGIMEAVEGTSFDFRSMTPLSAAINSEQQQTEYGQGLDHSWAIERDDSENSLCLAARLLSEKTGRTLDVWTDQPAMHVYSGNFLNGETKGKGGACYQARGGLCLEAQDFPDSPNQPAFPSVLLRAGQDYSRKIIYAFGSL